VYQSCRKDPAAGNEDDLSKCGLEDPPTPRFSSADKARSRVELRDFDRAAQIESATCTTCDNRPTDDTEAFARDKFSCLTKPLAPGAPETTVRLRHAYLKLLLERRGHRLSEDQRRAIIALYAQYPADRPACGEDWQPPEPSAADVGGAIQLCRRLASSHDLTAIQVRSAESLAPVCIEAVEKARALADSVPHKDVYVTESARASTLVLINAFSSLTEEDTKLRRDVLQNRLKLISRWYSAVKGAALPDEGAASGLARSLDSITAALWSGLSAKEFAHLEARAKTDPSGAIAFAEHLGEASASDRELLEALFGQGTGSATLSTTPLLAMFTDAMTRMDLRLQEYSGYHDLACRFLDCATSPRKTELSILQRIFAAIPDKTLLAKELAEASALENSGSVKFSSEGKSWRTTLTLILARHVALESAILDALSAANNQPYRPALGYQLSAEAPPALRAFTSMMEGVQGRVERYAKTGQFINAAGSDEIVLGFRHANQVVITDAVRAAADRLSRARGEYDSGRSTMLNSLMAEARSAATSNAGMARVRQIIDDMKPIVDDMNGLRVTDEQDAVRFADFLASYAAAMQAAAGEEPPMHVERQLSPVTIHASDARYTGGGANSTESAIRQPDSPQPWKVLSGQAGDVVNLSISGTWSPTCAMKNVGTWGDDEELKLRKAAETAPETTSQGFSGQFTTGGFDTSSHRGAWNSTETASLTTCLHAEAGLDWPIIWKLKFTTVTDACLAWSGSRSDTWENSSGTESRTSAAFNNGIRLPNTPFPDYPVGSLLAVLAEPAGAGQTPKIIDVQVVLPERFSVLFHRDADLYLVVNDRSCDSSRGQLAMQGVHMRPTGTKMKQLGEAMASLRQSIAEQAPALVAQGRLLPSQTALLRTMAWQKLRLACKCDPDSYPSSVRGFYSLWIETEVARIERQVEVVGLQRRLQQLSVELESTGRQIEAEQSQAHMGSLLATLALSSLDVDSLHAQTAALMKVVQSELAPFLTLRYPEAISGSDGLLQVDADRKIMEKLLRLDWATPTDRHVDDVVKAVESAVDHLNKAASKAPQPYVTTMVVGFRNPYVPAPPTGPVPSSWKWIEDARARDIWDSIRAGKRVFIEIRPEDVYGRDVTSLDCNNVTPVVAALALYVARPQDTANDSLNSGRWSTRIRAETRMVFPVVEGQRVVQFTNADWLRKPVRFLYGSEIQALDVFHRIAQAERTSEGLSPYDGGLVGVSPFTRFVVEPIVLQAGGKEINLADPIKNVSGKSDATALMLILELEARIDSREAKGIGTCPPQK